MSLALAVVGLLVLAGAAATARRRRARREEAAPPTSARPPEGALPGRARRRAAAGAVVLAVVTGTLLIGIPASAQILSDCKESPEPERPGTGMVGSIDPTPPGQGRPGSVYGEVGYAGLVWHWYDLGCGPSAITNTGAQLDTTMGNWLFDVAKVMVATTNALHYYLEQGSQLFAPVDQFLQNAVQAAWDGVFTRFITVALIISAVMVLWMSQSGQIAPIARHVALGVLALGAAGVAVAAPAMLYQPLDALVLDGTNQIQQGFLEPRGAGDANTLPTVLHDRLVYETWQRGEFGSTTAPQARDLSRDLLDAQAFTKQEVASGQDGQEQADAKKTAFEQVAERVGDRYPDFQGKAENRSGIGGFAVLEAFAICLFQIAAKLVVLAGMLVLRLLIVLLPVVAVVGVVTPNILLGVLRVGGMALVNALVVAALAGVHSFLVLGLLDEANNVPQTFAILVSLLVSVVLWSVARPFKRMFSVGREIGKQTGLGEGGGNVLGPVLGGVTRGLFTAGAARAGARAGARDNNGVGEWLRGRGERPEGNTPPLTPTPTVPSSGGTPPRGPVHAQGWRFVGQPVGSLGRPTAAASGLPPRGSSAGPGPSSPGGAAPGPGALPGAPSTGRRNGQAGPAAGPGPSAGGGRPAGQPGAPGADPGHGGGRRQRSGGPSGTTGGGAGSGGSRGGGWVPSWLRRSPGRDPGAPGPAGGSPGSRPGGGERRAGTRDGAAPPPRSGTRRSRPADGQNIYMSGEQGPRREPRPAEVTKDEAGNQVYTIYTNPGGRPGEGTAREQSRDDDRDRNQRGDQ